MSGKFEREVIIIRYHETKIGRIIEEEFDSRVGNAVFSYIMDKGIEFIKQITDEDITEIKGNGLMTDDFSQSLVRCASVLERQLMDYDESIKAMVDKFEEKKFGINTILLAIKQKIEMGYDKSQLEVDFGELDECEGYYLSKVNGCGTTPITPILAVEGEFDDQDLIKELDKFGVFYNV